jgi:hypothetical protein
MLADWYCEALLTMFDEKPDAAGIGGWITNPQLPPFGRAFFWFLRMFLIYGGTPGKVLPSGFNTPMFVVQPQSPFQTECLEGGNMCISLEHARDCDSMSAMSALLAMPMLKIWTSPMSSESMAHFG